MLIFQGWGALGGLIAVALVGAALESVTGSRAFSYVVAGVLLVALGLFLNVLRSHERHALFWIPIEYWGGLIAIGALAGL